MTKLNGTYGKAKIGKVPAVKKSPMQIVSTRLFKSARDEDWQCQICGLYDDSAGIETEVHIPNVSKFRQSFHLDCVDKLAAAAIKATFKPVLKTRRTRK